MPVLIVEIDPTSAESGASRVEAAVKKVSDSGERMATVFDTVAKKLEQFATQFQTLQSGLNQTVQIEQALIKSTQEITGAIHAQTRAFQASIETIRSNAAAHRQVNDEQQQTRKTQQELIGGLRSSSEATERATKNAQAYGSTLRQSGSSVAQFITPLEKATDVVNELTLAQERFNKEKARRQQSASFQYEDEAGRLQKIVDVQSLYLKGLITQREYEEQLVRINVIAKTGNEELASSIAKLTQTQRENNRAIQERNKALASPVALPETKETNTADSAAAKSLTVLREKIRIQNEAIVGGIKLRDVADQLAIVELKASGVSGELARALVQARNEFAANSKEIKDMGSALERTFPTFEKLQQLKATQASAVNKGEFLDLQRQIALYEQVISKEISLEEAEQRVVVVHETARLGTKQLAEEYVRLGQTLENTKRKATELAEASRLTQSTLKPLPALSALQQSQIPQVAARTDSSAELLALQRKAELYKQVSVGAMTLAEAEKRIAVVAETARTGSVALATALINQREATEQARRVATSTLDQEIAAIQREIQVKQQAIAGTLTLKKAEEQLAVERAKARGLSQQEAESYVRQQSALNTITRQYEQLTNAKTKVASVGANVVQQFDQLGHSLRRVIEIALGISAVTLLARGLSETFDQVKKGFTLSGELEKNKLAIASLLQGTTELTDQFGNVVNGTQAWTANLAEAKSLQRDIAAISAETLGTNVELLDVFRTALSFSRGQQASVQEILKLSQAITNIGKLQGLEATRLTDETRQILQLESNRGQTILAQLGISIQQARQYKAQGILVQELIKATAAYNELAKESATSWEGLVTSIETFSNLFRVEVFAGVFNAIKAVAKGMTDELKKLSAEGGISDSIGVSEQQLKDFGRLVADVFAEIQIHIAAATEALILLSLAFTDAGNTAKQVNDPTRSLAERMESARESALSFIESLAKLIRALLTLFATIKLISIGATLGTLLGGPGAGTAIGVLVGSIAALGASILGLKLTDPIFDDLRKNIDDITKKRQEISETNKEIAALLNNALLANRGDPQTFQRIFDGLTQALEDAVKKQEPLNNAQKEGVASLLEQTRSAYGATAAWKAFAAAAEKAGVVDLSGLTRAGQDVDNFKEKLISLQNEIQKAAANIEKDLAVRTGNFAEFIALETAIAKQEIEKKFQGANLDDTETQIAKARLTAQKEGDIRKEVFQGELTRINRLAEERNAAAETEQAQAKATADIRINAAETNLATLQEEITRAGDLTNVGEQYLALKRQEIIAHRDVAQAKIQSDQIEQAGLAKNIQSERQKLSDLRAERAKLVQQLNQIPTVALNVTGPPSPQQAIQQAGRDDLRKRLQDQFLAIEENIKRTDLAIQKMQASQRSGQDNIANARKRQQIEELKALRDIDTTEREIVRERIEAERQLQELRQSSLSLARAQAEKSVGDIDNRKAILEAEVGLLRSQGVSIETIAEKELQILGTIRQQLQERIKIAQTQLVEARQRSQDAQSELSRLQVLEEAQRKTNQYGAISKQTQQDLTNAKKTVQARLEEEVNLERDLAALKKDASVEEIKAREKILDLQREAAQNAVLSVDDVRSFFDNFITGIQQGNQKLGEIFTDFAQSISAKFFKQLLVGKNDNFDAPIIGNVSSLFGDNGIVTNIMRDGGILGFAGFTSAFQKGIGGNGGGQGLGLIGDLISGKGGSSFVTNFGNGFRNLGKTSSQNFASGFDAGSVNWGAIFPSAGDSAQTFGFNDFGIQSGAQFQQGFDASTVDWKLADNLSKTPGWTSADVAKLGGQNGTQWLQGLGAGIAGFGVGDMISGFFGVGQSKTGKLGSTIGGAVFGAVGFAIAGPIGAAIGAALGNILGGIIGDLFKPGRIQIEKEKMEKFFEDVFKNLNFKVIKENAAAQGFAAYKEGTDAALALGAVYARSIGEKATQGTIVRFAGQLLGNFEDMGIGAEQAKVKIQELANAMGADLASAIDAINGLTTSFSKNQKNSLLSIDEFAEEIAEARRNLAKYGDTSKLTARELTELATANGNTGSRIVTYGQLITGAIQINTKFADSTLIATHVQRLMAERFLEVTKAQGDFGDQTQSLSEEVRKGNLSLEEAILVYNALRAAAGEAALELKDFTLDPEKIQKLADIIVHLATVFDDLKKNLGEGLSSALAEDIDPSKFGQKFDELMNATLKSSIIKAIVTGFIEGSAVENLKPLTDEINALLVDVGTGQLSLTDFSVKLNESLAANEASIEAVKDAWLATATAGKEVLKQFQLNAIDIEGLKSTISNGLTQGLNEGLDPTKYGARFDELFNGILKTAIISAIVQGFVEGLAVEALKPLFGRFQELLKQLSENKISFDDFRTQFHDALDAAQGDIHKLRDAFAEVGQAATEIVKEFTSTTFDFGGLKTALSSALQEGLTQGLDPADYEQKFVDVFREILRNTIITAIVEGFAKGLAIETLRPLFEKIQSLVKSLGEGTISAVDFTTQFNAALTASGPQLEALRQGFVAVGKASDEILKSLGLWAPSLDAVQTKVEDLAGQLDDIAQRKIDIEVTLHQRLADIGVPGAITKAIDVEVGFIQADLNKRRAATGIAPGSALPDPNNLKAVQQFGRNITAAMDDIRKLGDLEVQRFHNIEQEITERYTKEIEAIKKAGQAQQEAIRDNFKAQIDASKKRVDALNKEKDALKESTDALEKQVDIAKKFKDVSDSIRDALVKIGGSGRSPVSPQGQFSFLERTANTLRTQLTKETRPEKIPDLISRLSEVLQQQLGLDVFQRPSTQYKDSFSRIVKELERLQSLANQYGGNADDLQEQLLEIQERNEETLKSIETKIETEQELQQQLSDQQEVALKVAAAQVEAAIVASEASRDAEIQAVRETTQTKLEELAAQERELANRAEGVLLSQQDILYAQLDVLRSIDNKIGGFLASAQNGNARVGITNGTVVPQMSNGTVTQGPLGRDLTGDRGAQLLNLPSAHGSVVTTSTRNTTYPTGWDASTQPGQKWDGNKWTFVESGADVTWNAANNTSYLHGQPLTENEVQTLLQQGLSSTGTVPQAEWDYRTQPGQKWDGGRWMFVERDADVTWNAATNTSYLHGRPLTETDVQTLLKYGLSATGTVPQIPVENVSQSAPMIEPLIVPGPGAVGAQDHWVGEVPPTQTGTTSYMPPPSVTGTTPTNEDSGWKPFAGANESVGLEDDRWKPFGMTYAASGFEGLVTHPRLFTAGESGPEYVNIRPIHEMMNTGNQLPQRKPVESFTDIGNQRRGEGETVVVKVEGDEIHVHINGPVENPEKIGKEISLSIAQEKKKDFLAMLRTTEARTAIQSITKGGTR